MTESTLKTVVVLDPDTQGYKPAAHNLTASDALNLVEQFSGENRATKILDQDERHRTSNATKCGRCKKASDAASEDEANHVQTAEPATS